MVILRFAWQALSLVTITCAVPQQYYHALTAEHRYMVGGCKVTFHSHAKVTVDQAN